MSGIIGVSPDMKSGVVGKYPDGHVLKTKHYPIFNSSTEQQTNAVILTMDTMTLSSSSNKVLTFGDFSIGGNRGGSMKLQYSAGGGGWTNITTSDMGTNDDDQAGVAVLGLHMNFGVSADPSGTAIQTSFNYLHAPGNSTVQYRLAISAAVSTYYISINRRATDDNWGGLSWVVQQEISA